MRIKLRRVDGFSSSAVSVLAKRCLAASCSVISDGLQCFAAVTKVGCSYQAIKTGGGAASARKPAFKWVNTALGNIKAAIVGTYRSINSKHVPRYLLALRQAIWRKTNPHWIVFGIPNVLYTDNGSDFTWAHLEQVAAKVLLAAATRI